jgi:hypothetical protein
MVEQHENALGLWSWAVTATGGAKASPCLHDKRVRAAAISREGAGPRHFKTDFVETHRFVYSTRFGLWTGIESQADPFSRGHFYFILEARRASRIDDHRVAQRKVSDAANTDRVLAIRDMMDHEDAQFIGDAALYA